MALRRRFLPVFKKHAPRGKPRFAKPLQGHFGPAAKHSQKHKNRPKIGRFSHFNPSAEMHPFSLFSASKAPQKWLCDAICRKKQLFAGSFGSRSHSFCSFTHVDVLSFGNTVLDFASATLVCGAERIRLSSREFEIMRLLLRAEGNNISKETILTKVWGYDSDAVENHVEVYIGFLRKKLANIGSNVRIEAIRRLGYHLEVCVHA